MIESGSQHSLSTIGVHLLSLLSVRNDDVRILEDELRVRQIKREAAAMLLHRLKNYNVDGRFWQAFMRTVVVVFRHRWVV